MDLGLHGRWKNDASMPLPLQVGAVQGRQTARKDHLYYLILPRHGGEHRTRIRSPSDFRPMILHSTLGPLGIRQGRALCC